MTSSAQAARLVVAVAAAGCAAILATACGLTGSSTAPPAGPASTAGSSPSASTSGPAGNPGAIPAAAQSGPPPCATSALQVTVAGTDGAAAGSSYYPIQFRNTSSATCNLYGYPGVSFVTGAGGSQIGIPATEDSVHPRQFIDLAPGQVAHAELRLVDTGVYSPGDCAMVTAHVLRIYPPNQTAPVYASFTASTCAKAEQVLSVEAVEAGSSGP
jgi:Protein of unknown function (DUF4232)